MQGTLILHELYGRVLIVYMGSEIFEAIYSKVPQNECAINIS